MKNFSIEDVPFPSIPLKRAYSSLRAVLRAKRRGDDLIYTRSLYTCVISLYLGFPTVFEIHGPAGEDGALHDRLFRHIIGHRRLISIVVITRALSSFLQARYGIPESFITVAPDAADIPAPSEPVEELDPGRFHVGYVGHLYPGRGIELLVELARTRPEIDFHCVGGLEADIEYWRGKTLEFPNFHLHGYVPFADTPRYRSAFDVLVAPYMRKVSIYGYGRDDTNTAAWMSPMKIFEYMAAQKAIITSDLPAIREVLADGQNALLCNPDVFDEWETAIDRLKSDSAFRLALADSAFGEFLDKYTWEARARKILASVADPSGGR